MWDFYQMDSGVCFAGDQQSALFGQLVLGKEKRNLPMGRGFYSDEYRGGCCPQRFVTAIAWRLNGKTVMAGVRHS